jgi:Ni2+-binding GTPase involved in maturation of urease and hydrogenase
MTDVKLHLVSGFLASGKTSAIARAAQMLLADGLRVGVITNDQGKHLVDTLFLQTQDVPTVEVTGRCFCCGYDDLNERLDELVARVRPDVIFAESVGSCTDVIATVMRPLLDLRHLSSSLSVFTDSRLLERHLMKQEVPFSEDVMYVFEQQIAEAELLILNKIDLIADPDALEARARAAYPGKRIKRQSVKDEASLRAWVDLLQHAPSGSPLNALPDIDYARYARGEARLAWLNAEYALDGAGAEATARALVDGLFAAIRAAALPVGHVKAALYAGGQSTKLSYDESAGQDWQGALDVPAGEQVTLVINARVETESDHLTALLDAARATAAVASPQVSINLQHLEAFHPAEPRPTHRYADS